MTIAPGRRFGPYEIVALAGAGGMGEVYRARDTRIGRDVALKILPSSFALDADRLRRFEQEARAAGLLNHPSIVSIFDVGTSDDTPYLVSEFLEGATLREALGEGPLPARRIVEWALQIAHGLAAAHEKGIAHRDLKPENIFVTRDRRVKILDFGLAKLKGAEAGFAENTQTTPLDTAPGVVLGTVGYMAPEQVRGEPADHRSDIFAFGAILYEMLFGRRAFQRGTAVETMTAILRDEPPDVPPDRPLPPALERVARRCLEKRPEDRFQSARDLAFALEALSTAETAAGAPAPKATRAMPVVVVIGLAATFAAGWLLRMPPAAAPIDQWRARRLVATPAEELGGAISPDGKWVAYLSNARGRSDLWVRFVSGGEAVNLTAAHEIDVQSHSNVGGVDISPDGGSIAFDAGSPGADNINYSSWTVPAPLGGTPRLFVHRGRGLRWSPDGRRIAYIRAGATSGDILEIADANGENARRLVDAQGGRHLHWLAWSADSRHVYFTAGLSAANRAAAETFRVAASGGAIEPVLRTSRRAIYAVPTPDGKGLIYAADPGGAELGLWWRALDGGAPRPITTGVGEYAEPRVAAAGDRIVCTLFDRRQSLAAINTREAAPVLRSLTDGSHGDLFPSVSPQTGRIVFSSSRSGQRNLWIANADGSGPKPLTEGAYLDETPAVSPDGKQVAFISDRGGRRGIWIVGFDGAAPRRLIDVDVIDTLSWSPDGRSLAYTAPDGNLPRVWTISVADRKVSRLPLNEPAHSPAWSPVGDMLAYFTPGDIAAGSSPRLRIVNSRGASVGQLPTGGPSPSTAHTAWSPDGKRLAVVPFAGTVGWVIWVVEPQGREVYRRLATFPVGVRGFGVTWSADGSSIIVGRDEERSDLLLLEKQ